MHRYLIASLALFLVLIATPNPSSAQDMLELKDHYLYGVQCTLYENGHVEDSWVLINKVDGSASLVSQSQLNSIAPAINWQSLVISQIIRWPQNTGTIEFVTTGDADQYVDFLNTVVDTFFNKKRGTANTVKINVTQRTIPLDPAQDYTQFYGDGFNSILITADDEFIGDGVTAYVTTALSLSGTQDANGEIHSRLIIGEADAYFRSHLVTSGYTLYPVSVIVHEFGHAIGYPHSLFPEDPMSYNRHSISLANLFEKPRVVKMRDRLYYNQAVRSTKQFVTGKVIDLGYGKPPAKSEDSVNGNKHHPFAFTTLGGGDGNSLSVDVYRGKGVNPDRLIASASGESFIQRYPDDNGTIWVFDYEVGVLFIGNGAFYNSLKKNLNAYGVEKTIDGATYEKAIYVTFEATGNISGDGKPATVRTGAWIVDTGPRDN